MSTWSAWALNQALSDQDPREWHVYRVVIANGQYTDNYEQARYSKRQYREYVVSIVLAPLSLRVSHFSSPQQLLELLNSQSQSQASLSE
jgi:hypothetical protein